MTETLSWAEALGLAINTLSQAMWLLHMGWLWLYWRGAENRKHPLRYWLRVFAVLLMLVNVLQAGFLVFWISAGFAPPGIRDAIAVDQKIDGITFLMLEVVLMAAGILIWRLRRKFEQTLVERQVQKEEGIH